MALRAHVWITGIVQGVAFRYYTRRQAARLGLTGWVRNLRDGRVEAIFEGDEDRVENMLRWCREGPPGARVDDLKMEKSQATAEFATFDITF
jgi:acylphosphatase